MFEFALPDVGEGVAEGELVAWHVAPGDAVAEDQVLAEVETDKAVVDLPSPVAGTVEALHAEAGEVVPVGDVVVTIDPDDAADANVDTEDAVAEATEAVGGGAADGEGGSEAGDDAATATAAGRIFAPPSVRRLARERDVDLSRVAGSGPGGRITAADVQEAAGASGAADADVADAITEVAPETDVGEEGRESGVGTEAAVERAAEGDGTDASPRTSAVRRVGSEGADPADAGGTTAAADRERTAAVPATRRLADELGVDIDAVPTDETRDGTPFVDPAAVEAYAEAQQAAQAADAAAVAAGEAREADPARGSTARSDRDAPAGRVSREPYRGVRRSTGERMAESAYTAPHATHHDRAVVTSLVEARQAMKPRTEARGVDLTYLPFVLKAVVAGLQEYPVLNTSLDEDSEEVVYKHYYDLGVATATDAGLMVPVLRDVDEASLLEVASEVNELTAKARDRSIDRSEMQGGTFTVTNFGAIGGEYATPIINYPETAILGLGAIEQRPVVVDGEVEARHTLPLSLSIDHRVIDGADAARFTNTVIEYLENPSLLLLE